MYNNRNNSNGSNFNRKPPGSNQQWSNNQSNLFLIQKNILKFSKSNCFNRLKVMNNQFQNIPPLLPPPIISAPPQLMLLTPQMTQTNFNRMPFNSPTPVPLASIPPLIPPLIPTNLNAPLNMVMGIKPLLSIKPPQVIPLMLVPTQPPFSNIQPTPLLQIPLLPPSSIQSQQKHFQNQNIGTNKGTNKTNAHVNTNVPLNKQVGLLV